MVTPFYPSPQADGGYDRQDIVRWTRGTATLESSTRWKGGPPGTIRSSFDIVRTLLVGAPVLRSALAARRVSAERDCYCSVAEAELDGECPNQLAVRVRRTCMDAGDGRAVVTDLLDTASSTGNASLSECGAVSGSGIRLCWIRPQSRGT